MAIHIKRLHNLISSSTSIFNPIYRKSYIHVSHVSLPEKLISCFTSRYDFSACSAGLTGQIVSDAYSPRLEDAVERDHHEFLKWHKGGGMFHKSASIDPTALIDFGAVVHSGSLVGGNVHVGSGAVVGPNVAIGQWTKIGYNVSLANCTIGDSCIIHHGVSIGQDGFGFFVDEESTMVKKPQALKAHIGNNVEIGANSCIDRGSWRDTMIGDHSKIDNLVQIGHNVVIGKCCMLCGQVGIAGSVTIGDYVTLGGRVGVRDHVTIVSKVRLAAASCVTKDINKPGDYGGFPAVPIHEWRRQVANRCRTSK
ncbi:probable UDP-3-O-acylglucosamine N-acyltransferase 2, mitochondrial [Cynara cardunculus var. scolymus]|uniref:probable UDP-3-O-acylglucosamine N-acyltransferase 2, mitochondrial n=1 Tax=Cynara cardunculus var. scolymus TaxID=59895 RepID=UPI000D627516|nr:probable UDP-3-O-acylglucosamine N-acyltransferase 2, mitochondrial [Cynara cardunculus var. scolymus]